MRGDARCAAAHHASASAHPGRSQRGSHITAKITGGARARAERGARRMQPAGWPAPPAAPCCMQAGARRMHCRPACAKPQPPVMSHGTRRNPPTRGRQHQRSNQGAAQPRCVVDRSHCAPRAHAPGCLSRAPPLDTATDNQHEELAVPQGIRSLQWPTLPLPPHTHTHNPPITSPRQRCRGHSACTPHY
jgi:hypothetical protein